MNPVESLLAGIAPEHAAGVIAGLLAAAWMLASRWLAAVDDPVRRWAATLLVVTAAVHLALPLGHRHGGPLLAAGFVAAGAGYGWLAGRVRHGRRWRLPAALLVVATLVAYLVVAGRGEEPDQVGLATALVELVILGLAALPVADAPRPRRAAGFAAAAATITATFLVGAIAWIAAFTAHTAGASAETVARADESDGHGHHGGRTQAGVLVRPGSAGHHAGEATAAQRRAAADLAATTRAAVARYASLDAAYAAGFKPSVMGEGTDVHVEHFGHKTDGRILDPERPEMLVYAIQGGRAALLGAVYVMDEAGRPGPEPGGPITRWHAHNLCVSALPPGIGVVTPFGNCPAFSVAVGSPEMMHVWVVDNPAGPFADGLDAPLASAHNARHGLPYHRR